MVPGERRKLAWHQWMDALPGIDLVSKCAIVHKNELGLVTDLNRRRTRVTGAKETKS